MDISLHEDVLIKQVIETHTPDGSYVDSAPLLCLTENTIRFVMASIVPTQIKAAASDRKHDMKVVTKNRELGCIINRISREMMRNNTRDTNKHKTTMTLLGLVDGYAWNMKTVLVLAAVAASYAELALILKLNKVNPLASSVLLLKQLQNISMKTKELKGYFKALGYLVSKMIEVSKCIINFESHHPDYISMDFKSTKSVKAYIHVAAYWIVRSAVACSSQISSIIAAKEQTHLVIASWELWSLSTRLHGVHRHLRKLLDTCYLQLEENLQSMLLTLFEEVHDDNQKVLRTLLAMKDELPLKLGSSLEKLSISNLRDKVVILFISHYEVPIEKHLLLAQQLKDTEKAYEYPFEVVWVPISRTRPSTSLEQRILEKTASMLPWYCIHKPCTLSITVVNYIKDAWFGKEEPVMVVLDTKGNIINSDAINMVFIWGTMAYPFSTSREEDLWKSQSWTIQFLMDAIDPTLSLLIEEGRLICLYGGGNIEWIRNISTYLKSITKSGISLKLVYVGCNSNQEGMLEAIVQENLSECLQRIKMSLFWLRLQSMRRSRLNLGNNKNSDNIIQAIDNLIEPEAITRGWLLVSEGSSNESVTIPGSKALDILIKFQVWGANIEKEGFLNSLRNANRRREKIKHSISSILLPYAKNMAEGRMVCKECGGTMDMHVVFECKSTNQTSFQ